MQMKNICIIINLTIIPRHLLPKRTAGIGWFNGFYLLGSKLIGKIIIFTSSNVNKQAFTGECQRKIMI